MFNSFVKLSFVIPAYNIEKTVQRCVKSIISQGIKSFEIIIVDDCSTDATASIVEELSNEYENVIYYKQEKNMGPGAARNKGIELARGEYIEFVDGDDYLKENTIDKALDLIEKEKADMLIFGFESFGVRNRTHISYAKGMYSKQDFNILLNDTFNKSILNSCFNKIYKKSMITYPFPTSIFIGEDLVFNVGNYRNYNKICIISDECYMYDNTQASLTRSNYKMSLEKIDFMCERCIELFRDCGLTKNEMTFLYYYYGAGILNDFVFSKDYKKSYSMFKGIVTRYENVFKLASLHSHCSDKAIGFIANNRLLAAYLRLKNRSFVKKSKLLVKRILYRV